LLADLAAIASQARTPAARRIGALAIVFLVLATILGVWGLVEMLGGGSRRGYRAAADDGEAVRFTHGDAVWVAVRVHEWGRIAGPPTYYVAPEPAYLAARAEGRFDGQLLLGMDEHLRERFADAGHPVPPRAYTLQENGAGDAFRAAGQTMLIAALVLAALAIAGIWYASRTRDSEIG
jgi:hypothetical protein